MWFVMMAAMMLPAITPVVLFLRATQRGRTSAGTSAIMSISFVTGYLAVWNVAGILADLAYLSARSAGDRLPSGSGAVPLAGGGLLVLAGLYQYSSAKFAYLSHCRLPIYRILRDKGEKPLPALRVGAFHGLSCLGCCWGIMAVLFVVGLMNLAWMAALCVLIVVERVSSRGIATGRVIGTLFIALGAFMAARPSCSPPRGSCLPHQCPCPPSPRIHLRSVRSTMP